MSTLNVSNITDGTTTVGTSYVVNGSAKAWVNTDSGGSPLSSLNVATVTDNGTGNYTINFTSNFTIDGNDNGVAVALCAGNNGEGVRCAGSTSGTLELRSYNTSNAALDRHVSASIHGDLA
jgi:hypothetical protein